MNMQAMKARLADMGMTAAVAATCGVLGGLGGWVAMSIAAEIRNGSSEYYIPYQGQLDLGGQPVDGPTEFVFALYDAPDDGLAPIWTSGTRTLQVSGGHFAVVLGSEDDPDSLDASIMGRDALYVGMQVEGVELEGRQRLLGVPFAQNSAAGKVFVVDNQIRGLGGAKIDGVTEVQTLSVTGTAGATTFAGRITANSGANITGQTVLSQLQVGGDKLNANLVQIKRVNVGSRTTRDNYQQNDYFIGDSGVKTSDWDCVLGGFDYGNGDFFENDWGPMMFANTYKKPGTNTWWVRLFYRHHNRAPSDLNADLLCFRKNISQDQR